MASAVLKMPTPIRPAKHPKPMVCIDDVTMAFGDFVATENVNITVADGEFVSVVGPTGCGKSTILNAVAGLLKPAKGSVTIDDQPVSGIQGDIGYLFQQEALLPWKTAFENVELGLKFRSDISKAERAEKVDAWLVKVGLAGSEKTLSAPVVRRPAQTRSDGPGPDHRTQGDPDGRTLFGFGHPHPPPDAERAFAALVGRSARSDHDHSRSGRGHRLGRPRRRPSLRPTQQCGRELPCRSGAAARCGRNQARSTIHRSVPRHLGLPARRSGEKLCTS